MLRFILYILYSIGSNGDRMEFRYEGGVKSGPALYYFADGSLEVSGANRHFHCSLCTADFPNGKEEKGENVGIGGEFCRKHKDRVCRVKFSSCLF
jgi:hypothetical protein